MTFGLVRSVLETHGFEPPAREREADTAVLRVDQALIDGADAPLVVALLERAGVGAAGVRPALVGPGPAADGAEEAPARDWRAAALGLGLLVPRAGQGEAVVLHREHLAAPGRLALCAGRLAACGAFGMLALESDAIVTAAVLAGGPLIVPEPRVLGVELGGSPASGVGGADLALALLARLRDPGGAVDVLELDGPGVAALAMAERASAAWLLAEAGVPALFPSDDATRAELAALGRDQDWRRLAPDASGAGARIDLDLATLEPLVAPVEEIAAARPARELVGTPLDRVLVGPGATLADLAGLAARLAGRRVHERIECTVIAGSRGLLDRAAAAGMVERLVAAGVRVTEGQTSAHAGGAGLGLCCGVPLTALGRGRARWLVAGMETCAAAALAGAVAVPGAAGAEPPPAPAGIAAAPPWMVAGADAPAPENLAGQASSRSPRVRRGPVRGEVLAVLGDGLECAGLLAPGARADGARGRLRELAGLLLAALDPGFARRAHALGGGFVVAGRGFARGEPCATVALCLAESGVGAVLARSFVATMARALVHAGVMPLILAPETAGALERGDELELPGLPEALVPAHPLTARNLTRGSHVALRHALSAREIAVVRVGGLLPFVTGGAPVAGGG